MSDYEFYRTTARPARTMGMNGREMLNMIFFVEPPRKRTKPKPSPRLRTWLIQPPEGRFVSVVAHDRSEARGLAKRSLGPLPKGTKIELL